MSEATLDTVTINGVRYVKEGQHQAECKPGKRAVVVVDRGWIFAGDVESRDGFLWLTRALQILSWSQNGFAGMCADPKKSGAKLLKMDQPVQVPVDSEIFRVPVGDQWGL